MSITMSKETVQEEFRNGILNALDTIARQVFENVPAKNMLGAADEDLPELFKDIDAQIARLCRRYDVILVEP